jgi:hypothetical protein
MPNFKVSSAVIISRIMNQRLRQQWWVFLKIPSSAAIRIEYLMVLLFKLIAQGQQTVARQPDGGRTSPILTSRIQRVFAVRRGRIGIL